MKNSNIIRMVYVGNRLCDIRFVKGNPKQSIPHLIIGIDCITQLPCFEHMVTKDHGNTLWNAIKESQRKSKSGWIYYVLNETYLTSLVGESQKILDAGIRHQQA